MRTKKLQVRPLNPYRVDQRGRTWKPEGYSQLLEGADVNTHIFYPSMRQPEF